MGLFFVVVVDPWTVFTYTNSALALDELVLDSQTRNSESLSIKLSRGLQQTSVRFQLLVTGSLLHKVDLPLRPLVSVSALPLRPNSPFVTIRFRDSTVGRLDRPTLTRMISWGVTHRTTGRLLFYTPDKGRKNLVHQDDTVMRLLSLGRRTLKSIDQQGTLPRGDVGVPLKFFSPNTGEFL